MNSEKQRKNGKIDEAGKKKTCLAWGAVDCPMVEDLGVSVNPVFGAWGRLYLLHCPSFFAPGFLG
jgi:hypothetical protein